MKANDWDIFLVSFICHFVKLSHLVPFILSLPFLLPHCLLLLSCLSSIYYESNLDKYRKYSYKSGRVAFMQPTFYTSGNFFLVFLILNMPCICFLIRLLVLFFSCAERIQNKCYGKSDCHNNVDISHNMQIWTLWKVHCYHVRSKRNFYLILYSKMLTFSVEMLWVVSKILGGLSKEFCLWKFVFPGFQQQRLLPPWVAFQEESSILEKGKHNFWATPCLF